MYYLILILFLLITPIEADIYIGFRVDNLPGSGTLADPFDGSSQVKFDALMNSAAANTNIHISPGTFLTMGSDAFAPKAGQKIYGSGIGITILKLSGYSINNVKHCHFQQLWTLTDGWELHNLTLDGNYLGLAPAGNHVHDTFGGVYVAGNNSIIQNVECINCYGDTTNGLEQFSLSLGGLSDSNQASNCQILNCFTHNYAPGANYTNGPEIAYGTNGLISNCTDDGGNHAFGFTDWNGGTATNCVTTNKTNTSYYTDTLSNTNISIINNNFSGKIPIQFNSAAPANSIIINNNRLFSNNSSGSGSAAIALTGSGFGSNFTITNNIFIYTGINNSGLILNNSSQFIGLNVNGNTSNVGLIGAGGGAQNVINSNNTVGTNNFNSPATIAAPPVGLDNNGNVYQTVSGGQYSQAFCVYQVDSNNNPIESSGIFYFKGIANSTGYTFANKMLQYAMLTNQ